jgi:2-keto-4-pentenoate hydratase/2-oxohepta-3-ene-1,7-dioic acid hydratase in catechol pathway
LPGGGFYGIGKNYAKHAREMGGVVPDEPIIFIKPPASYIQNGGTVILPGFSENVHHEVELVVVIGKDCANVSKENALDYVAGYAVGIDVTLRDIQNKAKTAGHPWAVSKGFVTSAPVSEIIPIEQTKDKFFDIELKVNGEIRQAGTTRVMERSVETLIVYLSKVFTLRTGDAIFTGTPEGVGKILKGDQLHAELKGYVELDVSVE